MTDAAVTTEIHQPFDIHRRLTTQVALDDEIRNRIADACDFGLRQVLHLRVGRDARCLANLLRARVAYAVNRGQRNHDVLVNRDIYACYTSHNSLPFQSALSLLMTFVGADDAHHAITADDLAVPAHFFH